MCCHPTFPASVLRSIYIIIVANTCLRDARAEQQMLHVVVELQEHQRCYARWRGFPLRPGRVFGRPPAVS